MEKEDKTGRKVVNWMPSVIYHPLSSHQKKDCVVKESQNNFTDMSTVIKKEAILEAQHTSSDPNTVIKDEFNVDESNEKTLAKKDADLHKSVLPSSDINSGIKEETSPVEESESTLEETSPVEGADSTLEDTSPVEGLETTLEEVQTVIISEEIFLEEADHEQFIDESCSYDVNKDVITEESCYEKQSFGVTDSGAGPWTKEIMPLNVVQNCTIPLLLVQQNTNVKSDERFGCDICNKTFAQKQDLSTHKSLIHDGAKKYKCDICKRSFRYLYNLTKHQLVYSRSKKYECVMCNKIFHSARTFSRHKLLHSDDNKLQCNVCNKCFTSARSLREHKVSHSGVKKYNCDVCNKAFSRVREVTRHKLVHSSIKTHKCDICNKCFAYQTNLKKHKLTHSKSDK